jgi:GntR family transcriptional repressor for pyruvate dehydrogenase complex
MKLIKKLSAADEVFNRLFEDISSGKLEEGHRFPNQDTMAEEFGVSRKTIREAINKLTVLGFLTAKPGVGTIVAKSSASEVLTSIGQYYFLQNINVQEFIEARLYIEKVAIRLAVQRATDKDIAKLQRILIDQGEAIASNQVELFSKLDIEFLRALIESGQNELLLQFLDIIWDGLAQFITEVCVHIRDSVARAFNFHNVIIKHLTDRDMAKAEKTMIYHIQDVAINIETHFPQHKGVTDVFKFELDK